MKFVTMNASVNHLTLFHGEGYPNMPVHADVFRQTLGKFASGVTVVTVTDVDGSHHGLTVSAFSSLSLNPPYILICIDKRSSSIPVIERVKAFGVNILASDQQHLSNQFASKREDKFTGVSFEKGPLGMPLLDGALANVECSLTQAVDGGDHVIFIGQMESSSLDDLKQPLVYFSGNYASLTE